LARFVVPIDMLPKVISILSVSSTAAATAALRALLARFDSPFVAHDDPDFVGRHPFGDTVGEPFSDRDRLSIGIGEALDDGFDAVESRDRAATAFSVVIHINERRLLSDFAKIR
jgi:hypothetical protein